MLFGRIRLTSNVICTLALTLLTLPMASVSVVGASGDDDFPSQYREIAARQVLAEMMREIDTLVGKKTDFRGLGKHKALAACIRWPEYAQAWNINTDNTSLQDAEAKAMKACNDRKSDDCQCAMVFSDSDVVLTTPDDQIDSYLHSNMNWMAQEDTMPTQPGEETVTSLLDIKSNSAPPQTPKTINLDFPLSPAHSVALTTSDCDFNYDCMCSAYFSMALSSTDEAKSSAYRNYLERLSKAGFVNCSDKLTSVLGETVDSNGRSVPVQKYCTYVGSLKSLPGSLAPAQLHAHNAIRLLKILGNKSISKVWVQSIVPVDENLIPIGPPSENTTPLLVESDSASYLVNVTKKSNGMGCEIGATYTNNIFDGEKCPNADACLGNGVAAYIRQITGAMKADPVGSDLYTQTSRPPGEFWFRRERKPAEILGGSPIREVSTYILKWWRPSLHALSTQVNDLGATTGFEKRIYVDITSENLVAIGNDRFREANDAELALFQAAVRNAGWGALLAACKDVSGEMNGETCVLR